MGCFSRDNSVEQEAFDRQGGLCAGCEKRLSRLNFEKGDPGAWHAHHIDGDPANNTVRNCACLCVNPPENCHLWAHDYDFARGCLAERREFPYLYGARTWRRFLPFY